MYLYIYICIHIYIYICRYMIAHVVLSLSIIWYDYYCDNIYIYVIETNVSLASCSIFWTHALPGKWIMVKVYITDLIPLHSHTWQKLEPMSGTKRMSYLAQVVGYNLGDLWHCGWDGWLRGSLLLENWFEWFEFDAQGYDSTSDVAVLEVQSQDRLVD